VRDRKPLLERVELAGVRHGVAALADRDADLLDAGAAPPAAVSDLEGRRGFARPLDISTSIVMIIVDMSSTLDVIACCQPLAASQLTDEEAEATATLFKALADPARVRIVNMLATQGEPVCACEFHPALGLSQATASHHLKKLTDAGLLEREQRGKWAYFSLNPEAVAGLAGLVDFPEVVR
jgi:ArsR family transcriptional regulator, arsenate/arsenite/antimonite-responsive transcriptional repressor